MTALKPGDEGVTLVEYDVRWFRGNTDTSILAPLEPDVLLITIPFQLKSQGGSSKNYMTAAGVTKKCRRHTMHALEPINLGQVTNFFSGLPKTIRISRLAPRSLDSDNNVTALKPFRDQVCAWLDGRNTLDARANDSLRSGYTFTYGQQRQQAYGVRIELSR